MANINLNDIFVPTVSVKSKVDSNIQLSQKTAFNEVYSDVKLDLEIGEFKTPILNGEETTYDIEKIYNEDSVINALKNILNTKFYSRLLNPDMNFDLRTYLFEELTEAKAFFIGYDIIHLLPAYEPRVKITNVEVIAYISSDAYMINLDISIPSISKKVKLSSVLTGDGFSFT